MSNALATLLKEQKGEEKLRAKMEKMGGEFHKLHDGGWFHIKKEHGEITIKNYSPTLDWEYTNGHAIPIDVLKRLGTER